MPFKCSVSIYTTADNPRIARASTTNCSGLEAPGNRRTAICARTLSRSGGPPWPEYAGRRWRWFAAALPESRAR
jgi:hypothetical protein